jgi:3-(3-hydroxy-phenyl)propionate hydroxylase
MVLDNRACDALLDTYASEREYAADENIRNSTRSTDFITPKSPVSRTFRDAVLKLARKHPFARQLANSGRLSVPAVLHDSALNSVDNESFEGKMVPGASCADAPVLADGKPAWLLSQLGNAFTGVVFCGKDGIDVETQRALKALQTGSIPFRLVVVASHGIHQAVHDLNGAVVLEDAEGLAWSRYDAKPGTFYLIRPDQHVCARWRAFDATRVDAALKRALCVEGVA